jgi:hypothetical protein
MALDDGRERLKCAVRILVEEKDRVKQRLLVAYASQLSLVDPRHDLPRELVNAFCGLRNAVSDAEMPYGLGERAAEKLRVMSEDEASTLAGKILSMCLAFGDIEATQRSAGTEAACKGQDSGDLTG